MFGSAWRLLGALPALAAAGGFYVWAGARRRAASRALGREAVLLRVAEDARARRRWAIGLRLGALAMIFLALAGPQWGVEALPTQGFARQVVIAVDSSLSMQTPDVKPNRLERAKSSLALLLDQLAGERVGVVAFAGDAQILCPLTQDTEAAKQILSALEVGAVPVPGTAIGTAIRTATNMLERYPGVKSLVLLTDGEDHRSDPIGAAKEAAAAGVRVFTIGVGTPEGEPIPLGNGGYKKDARGATVISRLGESDLAQIARLTGGAYERTSPGEEEISAIVGRIKSQSSAESFSGAATRWVNRYAYPLCIAMLFLMAELALPLSPLLLLFLFAVPSRASTAEGALRQGNQLYEQEKYEEALSRYAEAAAKRPSDPRPLFNAGDALFRLDRDSDSADAFGAVSARKDAPAPLRAAALYNEGDARYRAGNYAAAADAYRQALTLAPQDRDARYNLAVAILRRHQPPPKQKPPQKNQQPPPQPENQKNPNQPPPPQPRPRSQPDSLSREDAERVLRAAAESEKEAERRAGASALEMGRKAPKHSPTEEDW